MVQTVPNGPMKYQFKKNKYHEGYFVPLRTVPTGAEEDIMITITLKDGSKKEIEKGKSVLDVAKQISEGLARVTLAGIISPANS